MSSEASEVLVFEDELASIEDLLLHGRDVHVAGMRGYGKTTLLRELEERLDRLGRTVLSGRGTSQGRSMPLGVLRRLLDEPRREQAREYLDLEDLLARRLAHRRSVVLLDDVDRMDRESLAVIDLVTGRLGVPTAVTYSDDGAATLFPRLSSLARAQFRVEIQPLDMEATGRLAHWALGAEHELTGPLISRLFTKSAGNPGLIVAITATARQAGLIGLVEGHWSLIGPSLWNHHLGATVEALVSDLSPEVETALGHIALMGPAPATEILRVVPESALRELDRRRFVLALGSQAGGPIGVHPPVIADYYRHRSHSVSGVVAAVALARATGRRTDDFLPGPAGAAPDTSALAPDASAMVRYFQDRGRAERARRAARWHADPCAPTAIAYASALLADGHETERLARLLDDAPSTKADGDDLARLAALRAQWLAYDRRDVPAALAVLHRHGQDHPAWSGSMAALALLHEVNLLSVPTDAAARLAAHEGADPMGLIAPVRSFVEVVAGQPSAALTGLAHQPPSTTDLGARLGAMTLGLGLLGCGHVAEAAEQAEALRRRAIDELEREHIYDHTYMSVLCDLILGRAYDADRASATVLAMGRPGPATASLFEAVVRMGAVSARLGGRERLARALVESAGSFGADRAPLPAMQAGLTAAVEALVHDDLPAVAERLLAVTTESAGRGYGLAAAVSAAFALAVRPTAGVLDAAAPAIEALDGPAFRPVLALARALTAPDPEAVVRLVGEVDEDDAYLCGLMLGSRARLDDDEGRERARRAHDRLKARFPDLRARGTGPGALAGRLTTRELEVALLAGSLSNAEVAARLAVSKRTIENHISNALRKTRAPSRAELFRLVSADRA